ncbi:MAG: sulfatase-like hydrolase/transferase, partial [Pseudomonadota bacterium]
RRADRVLSLPLLVINPVTLEFLAAAGVTGGNLPHLQDHYIEPANAVRATDARPNVIHIFLESNEARFEDAETFGSVMAPLAHYDARGMKVTQLHQAAQTNWTIAGQVAATCGVPLIEPWLNLRTGYNGDTGLNGRTVGENFMANAFCLPDVLAREGYRTHFLKGASLSFAGAGGFAEAHSYDVALGRDDLTLWPDAGKNVWGYDDDVLLANADRLIDAAMDDGVPYLMTMTTLGGHPPEGLVSKVCRQGTIDAPVFDNEMLTALACTNTLVRGFLDGLEVRGALDNTVVILQSDHLMMSSTVSEALRAQERRNYFVMFGPGIEPTTIDRPAAMFDMYPTMLEVLGYSLPENAAGVGRSLLSDGQTLVETYGLKTVDKIIIRDRTLRHHLWAMPSTENVAAL